MREIKFRGRKVENGEWVYGDLIHEPWGTFIQYREGEPQELGNYSLPRHKTKVDPSTVGQFTGLCDKRGKEIYEGDIVKAYNGRIVGEVIYDSRGCYEGVKVSEVETWGFSNNFLEGKDVEVIGNIYENPELLEVR